MNLRFTALGAAVLLLAPAAFAQKPMPRSPLEIGFDTPRETVMRADLGMSVDARTQVPTGLFNLDFQATPGTRMRITSPQMDFTTTAVVRRCRTGEDNIPRVHVEFVGAEWPLDIEPPPDEKAAPEEK